MFRHPVGLSLVREHLAPEFLASHGQVSISSFGSSHGEDVYSLVLATSSLDGVTVRGYEYYSDRVEISNRFLVGSKSLVYREFANGPRGHEIPGIETLVGQHFLAIENGIVFLGPKGQARIKFFQTDLSNSIPVDKTDIGFLCNVLQHYEPPKGRILLENVAASISDGGYLYLTDVQFSVLDQMRRCDVVDDKVELGESLLTRVPLESFRRTDRNDGDEGKILLFRKTAVEVSLPGDRQIFPVDV